MIDLSSLVLSAHALHHISKLIAEHMIDQNVNHILSDKVRYDLTMKNSIECKHVKITKNIWDNPVITADECKISNNPLIDSGAKLRMAT